MESSAERRNVPSILRFSLISERPRDTDALRPNGSGPCGVAVPERRRRHPLGEHPGGQKPPSLETTFVLTETMFFLCCLRGSSSGPPRGTFLVKRCLPSGVRPRLPAGLPHVPARLALTCARPSPEENRAGDARATPLRSSNEPATTGRGVELCLAARGTFRRLEMLWRKRFGFGVSTHYRYLCFQVQEEED